MGCLLEGTWLCRQCRAYLPPVVTVCISCKQPSTRGLICSSCRSDYALTGVISAGQYSHPVFKRGVGWLKFKGVRSVAPDLASLLLPHLSLIAPLEQLVHSAMLVPIPLHSSRLRNRGFNQNEDIAGAISRYSGIPISNLLMRARATRTQSRLPHDLRAQNLASAFMIQKDVIAHSPAGGYQLAQLLILVDDVTTTGSTLEAAAKALKSYLPTQQVWAITIARG